MTPSAALDAALAAQLPPGPARLGVAVSGGGDSVALLALLAEWCATRGVHLAAATVDHGLRPDAAGEAALVGRHCAAFGVDHTVLEWAGSPGRGNLQAAARQARYDLLTGWAGDRGIDHVCLAHTRDDQAETVLLRLARGSGVDGLAGMMPVRWSAAGPAWLRPLLQVSRAALRTELRTRGLDWAEDPSNADARFARVQARAMLAAPPLAGLDASTLAETAGRMQAALHVLQQVAADAVPNLLSRRAGAVRIDLAGWRALADDTRWRIAAALFRRVGRSAYRPRLKPLIAALQAAEAGGAGALNGCLLTGAATALWLVREPAALGRASGTVPGNWDGRWRVSGPPATLAPLGDAGLACRRDWRAANVPRAALLTTPAVWSDGRLQAAPALDRHLGIEGAWTATPLWSTADIRTEMLFD